MKHLMLFFPLMFIAACSSTQQSTDITYPALIYQVPLPPFPRPVSIMSLRIPMQIHVTKDGSVDDVEFLSSSGSDEWDAAAKTAIHHWRYSPARTEGQMINIWLHQTAVVTFSEPQYIFLAEILCGSSEQADSVYALLQHGAVFSDLVQQFSIASSRSKKGELGTVNVQTYPDHIKKMLTRLSMDRYTEPVKYGEGYAVFKRLRE